MHGKNVSHERFKKTFQKTFHFWVQKRVKKEGAARRTFKANVKVNVTDFFGVFVVFAVAKCGTNIVQI